MMRRINTCLLLILSFTLAHSQLLFEDDEANYDYESDDVTIKDILGDTEVQTRFQL